jgi:hypothetical protein
MSKRKASLSAFLAASMLATAGADEPKSQAQPAAKARPAKSKQARKKDSMVEAAEAKAKAKAKAIKAEKAEEIKELDEQADKQWDSVAKKAKDLRGMIDDFKPADATTGPMIESLAELDKALGEPPAPRAKAELKIPTAESLGELVSNFKAIAPASTPDPTPSVPIAQGRQGTRDVKEILKRRSQATQPALLPEAKAPVEK